MRKLITFAITVLGLVALLCTSRANAQTAINSDGVSVRNSMPANVFFIFPVGSSDNVNEIQFGCSDSSVNRDWIFVYEEQPAGNNLTYPSHQTVNCNINITYNDRGYPVSMTGSLVGTLTVITADHTVTVDSASWTAAYRSGRTGYYWASTGGSSTITVQ